MFVELLKRKQILLTREIVVFILLILVTSLIGFETQNITTLLSYVFMTLMLVVLYNLFFLTKFDKRMFIHLSVVSSIVMLIGSLTLITDYFGITKFTLLFGEEIYREVVIKGRGAGILGGETNISASRMCSLLPLSLYLLFHVKETKMGFKLFIACTTIISIVAISLTASRMGFIALGQLFLIAGIKEIRGFKLIGKLSLVLGFVIIIVILVFSMKLLRDQTATLMRFENLAAMPELASIEYDDSDIDKSILNRFLLFWIGIDLIRKNPLFGIGVGNAKFVSVNYFPFDDQMKHLHNTYLDIGVENGLIMLGVLVFVLSGIILSSYKFYKRSGDHFYFYFALSSYTLIFCWLFISDFSNKLFWNLFLPLGLYIKNSNLIKKHE